MHYRTTPHADVDETEEEARPQICIPQGPDEREKTYIAILGDHDTHDCATSSKRKIHGPCVVLTDVRFGGTNQVVYGVENDKPWEYINRVINNLKGRVNDNDKG